MDWQRLITSGKRWRRVLKNADIESVSLADLEIFQRFKWLLDSSRRSSLSAWVKAILAKPGSAGFSSTGASSSTATTIARARASTKAKGKAKASSAPNVMRFFLKAARLTGILCALA